MLSCGDNGNAATGIFNQHGYLIAGKSRINGHIHSADGQGGKIRYRPLPAVFAYQRNAVALLRAPAEKSFGERADTLVELVRGNRLPLGELVLPQNRARISRIGYAMKQVIDGGERGRLCHFELYWDPTRLKARPLVSVSARSGELDSSLPRTFGLGDIYDALSCPIRCGSTLAGHRGSRPRFSASTFARVSRLRQRTSTVNCGRTQAAYRQMFIHFGLF